MKNPIKKTPKRVRFFTKIMATMMLLGNATQIPSNPFIQETYATEITYNNNELDGDTESIIDPRYKFDENKNIIPMDNIGGSNREYRAVQSACYDGKHIICAQNKNYGNSYKTSNNGGRIVWMDVKTGKLIATIEIGKEGGHMDGVAYDADRNMVLKPAKGKLLQIDNNTKDFAQVRYTDMSEYCNKLTYVPSIHQLVGLEGGKFIFMSYDSSKNEYVKQKEVKLENYHTKCGAQGIGTDGQNIFIADSGPESKSSNYRIWTYSLDGKLLEEHNLGSGYSDTRKEVESAMADNEGNLWLICPDGLIKAKNYKAHSVGINNNSQNSYGQVTNPVALQKLQNFLYFLCSFSTQKGGDVTYVKGSKENNHLNQEKLVLGKKNLHSDCSWFIFWGMVHAELLEDDKKEMVRSAEWGNNGYKNSIEVASFEKGEKWNYSNASPRRYYLGGTYFW